MTQSAKELQLSLSRLIGSESIITDTAPLELLSSDVYSRGITAAFAIKPSNRENLSEAIRQIIEAGYALFPRGAGSNQVGKT